MTDYNTWMDTRITENAFGLSPIHKPDMSPFLVHMTSSNSLISIIEGEDKSSDIGLIQSSIPRTNKNTYQIKMVCLTESPLFALDAFRRISNDRFQANQKYGIGFSKRELVKDHGFRPVVYLEHSLITQLQAIHADNPVTRVLTTNPSVNNAIKLSQSLRTLAFPLGERMGREGFSWEREWRLVDENGFYFPHSAIRVICCPPDERESIKSSLNCNLDNIQFVDSWAQYSEVTNYLKNLDLEAKAPTLDEIEDKLAQLKGKLYSYNETKASIQSLIEDLNNNKAEVDKIEQKIDELSQERDKLREAQKAAREMERRKRKSIDKPDDLPF